MRKVSLLVAGLFVFVSTLSLSAIAQEFDGTVKTVPAPNAPTLITSKVDETKLMALKSDPVPTTAKDLGPASGDMRLGMQLVLRRSLVQQQAVDLLNQQSTDPKAAMFGKTVTPAIYAETFGLAASDLETLQNWLTQQGFTIGNVDNGRMAIDFSGTVAQVEAAFQTQIHNYVDAQGVHRFANISDPQIPKALQSVVGRVNGLQNFKAFEPRNFDGPVTDFAAGTTNSLMMKAEQTPERPVVASIDGELLHDASFTASNSATVFKGFNDNPVAGGTTELNVRVGGETYPTTGSLQITDQNARNIAYVPDVTACPSYNNGLGHSCTITFTPVTAGTSYLTATYSGDAHNQGEVQSNVHADAGTGASVTVQTYVPITFGAQSGGQTTATINVSISWLGSGTQPTGTILLYDQNSSTLTQGAITLPAAGTTTIASGTACTTPAYAGTCTYSCTGNLTTKYISCAVSETDMTGIIAYYVLNEQLANYSGDTNYSAATGTGITWIWLQDIAPGLLPTMSATAPSPAITYGTATLETNTITFTGSSTYGAINTGTLAYSTANQGGTTGNKSADYPLVESNNPQLGMMGVANPTACTLTTGLCTYTNTFTVPAYAPAGTYTVTHTYSGNIYKTAYYGVASTTSSITVGQAATTLTLAPSPVVAAQGSVAGITITASVSTAGSGAAPTGTITFGGPYATYGSLSATTCTLSAGTCTVTFTPNGTTAIGTYTAFISATYSGDNNYSVPGSATTDNLQIKGAVVATMTTPTSTSPTTQPYGNLSASTVTGQLAYTGASVPTTADVSFTATGGTVGAASCTGATTPLVCTATFTPTATDAIGSYNINISFSGDSNYVAGASSQVGNYIVTKGTITTIQMTTSAYVTPPTPTTEAYGATTAFTVYATLSPVGATGVTAADVTFATSTAGIGTFGATTCAVVSGVDECHAVFTPNGTAAVGSYNINVSFSGDTNYNAAGPSANGTGLYVVTAATPTLSIAPSPIVANYQSTAGIVLTVTAGTPGTVNFTGSYATYGTLSATSCTITATTCTVTFTPNGTTAIGSYSNILTATLTPTSSNYTSASVNDSLTIAYLGGLVVIPSTPAGTVYTAGTSTVALTTTLSWTQAGTQPTGTILLTNTTNSLVIGGVTLPTSGTGTSGNCSTQPATGACTYTCTPNLTDQLVSCTLTDNATASKSIFEPASYQSVVSAAYTSTNNFVTGAGTTSVYYNTDAASGTVPTITPTALTGSTYGLTQTETATVTVKSNATTDPYPFQSGTNTFLQATSTNQVGTLYTTTNSACGSTTTTCVISGGTAGNTPPLFTIPAVVTPGSYTVTYYYTGNYQTADGYDKVGSATTGLTVSQQTPTFGTMTFSPAASEPYGTNQAITISDTLTYLGVGAIPTGAVTYTLNSVAYPATCSAPVPTGAGNAQSNVETCTATVPAGTIAALPVAAYPVTASSTADTNYATCSGSGTFTITANMTTLVLTADTPGSPSGGVTSVNLTATMSPAITGVTVTFTDSTTNATYQAQTNGSGVATVLITTSTTGVSGGLNAFVASVPAGSTYTAATSNTQNIYLQGLLFSSAAAHDFSVCYSNGGSGPGTVGCGQAVYPTDSVGTVAGSPLCGSGMNGYTCTTGYGVTIYNFTSAAVTPILNLTNSNQGTNAFSFATNCPTSLAAGATCEYVYYYLPPYGDGTSSTVGRYEAGGWSVSAAGTLSGIGDKAFDRSGAVTFPATLSGFAVLPVNNPVSVTPLNLTFGPQSSGSLSGTQNVVVTNSGASSIGLTFTPPSPSQFIVTNSCPSQLAAGANCTIGIAFQSSTAGTITGTLVVTPAGASAITVNLSGTVTSTPGYYLNTTAHNFGNISDGTTVTSGFTVTNNSGAPANFTIMPSGSSEYSITANTCASQVAAGASCSISVTFAPTAPGAASYSVTMSTVTQAYEFYPGGTVSATVTFTGTGVTGGNVTVGTSTHNWGDVQLNSTSTNYGVTLTNSTGAAVTLTYSSLSGTEFTVVQSQTNCGATLANNSSCQMAFSFTPTATGFTSQLYAITVNGASDQVYSNAAGAFVNGITLEGTGTTN